MLLFIAAFLVLPFIAALASVSVALQVRMVSYRARVIFPEDDIRGNVSAATTNSDTAKA